MPRWNTVAVIGVGLIGGSVGLALRARGLAERIVGIGRRATTLEEARRYEVVTETTTNLAEGVAEASLIIVCTPVDSIVDHVLSATSACPQDALLTDVGSTKGEIVAALSERMSNPTGGGPRFLGSHPLAGSEKQGARHARADLLEGRVVVVTPTQQTRREDIHVLTEFWESLGANVLVRTAKEHDEAVAAISHLPHLIASALAAGTPESAMPLVAGGWLDTTRVAAGDVELWRQILLDNRDHVLKSLDNFGKVLTSFRDALENRDDQELVGLLEAGKRNRDAVGN